MLSLLAWIIFGALVGWLASIVMGTNNQQGCLLNIVVGVFGAFIGGWLFRGTVTPNVFDIGSLITAFIGAVILLAIVNLATGRGLRG